MCNLHWCYTFCTGVTLSALVLHLNCTAPSQSESSRKTWLRHVRDGVELPEIARDDHYDFNFQEYHLLRNEVHMKPGDAMINVCIYNTEDRLIGIQGGPSTHDEMCLSFILYYPKVSVKKCMSREKPAYDAFVRKYYRLGDNPLKPTWWTDAVNKGLKDAYRDADKVVAKCSGRGHKPIKGAHNELISKPVITTPYKPEDVCEMIAAMGNRVGPGYLILLTLPVYLFALAD